MSPKDQRQEMMNSESKPDQGSESRRVHAAVQSTISSLKEIVTIVTGLTLTNAIVQLLTANNTIALGNIDRLALPLFVMLIANVIRFYHGNMRHLDIAYTAELGKGSSADLKFSGGRKVAVDFFVIFFQSVAFSIISFLIRQPKEFFILFISLLVVDVVWFLSVYQYAADRKAFAHQKRWTLNNTTGVFALLVGISTVSSLHSTIQVCVLGGILLVNTVIDYVISWEFYFPRYP